MVWCNVPYGHVLVFSPNYLHGGMINAEPETRWSMNCRFTVHGVYRRREEARFLLSAYNHAAGDAHGAAITRAIKI